MEVVRPHQGSVLADLSSWTALGSLQPGILLNGYHFCLLAANVLGLVADNKRNDVLQSVKI